MTGMKKPIMYKLTTYIPTDYLDAVKQALFDAGAGHIERLGKVAQSTMSNHLSVLQQAGLIQVEKYGQWSYFTRNEALIQQYIEHLKQTL